MVRLTNLNTSDVPVWGICGSGDVNDTKMGIKSVINKMKELNPERDVLFTNYPKCSHNDMAEAPYTEAFFDWVADKYF